MEDAVTPERFARASRRWLAKTISELTYEEVLAADESTLRLASGITYDFRAVRRAWSNLDIDPESIRRDGAAPSALQFVIDARAELAMQPAAEAMFLKELKNTLRQDCVIDARWGTLASDDLADLPTDALHAALEGHPKAVANKGRLGWGADDLKRYAPETPAPINLEWLALDPAHVRRGRGAGIEETALLRAAIGWAATRQLLAAAGSADSVLMPVHPWQWDNVLAQSLVADIAEGRARHLGRFGPAFVASPSLRTLMPMDGGSYEVKLALGILNTSAWRGMPGKYIEQGAAISDFVAKIVAEDPVTASTVTVQREVLGLWWEDPILAQAPRAPYRWHETLGAIWREHGEALRPGQRVVMAAALFHEGADGRPLIAAFAKRSRLSIEAWLQQLFSVSVVPLWHILCRYGLGFIAHGQNINIVLDSDRPVGITVKDFQGDLDLVDQDFPETAGLPAAARAVLPRKPPAHIVHNIQTAHFVTVLRFLSASLARRDLLDEGRFYQILRDTLRAHADAHPDLADRFALFDLFQPKMLRVAINRVRFQIGYEDYAERPLPTRGTDLDNPLWSEAETV
ncbi:IucA/IucC family siderophore biosynthesis protein [Jiella sp. MQZ9-1]|uniref:IucA/IucC family siderophore biosynthesis protein n=1 Tax=Jiella flava TaxID=2816857 RepID=A0A939FYF7_9HYPH|nr:IucA/IucC family protein [Jiella flava]MBO0662308.1 IucA/IucC family siderophore biosynthesis protein [Jiella flava]MCD2470861.1 IucA/IucC family siderophore biosynthesis protein [Jiella flava]